MTAPSCPNCHQPVVAVTGAGNPPWKCAPCRLGWWNAEVTPAAESSWRSGFRDFGDQTAAIAAAVAAEAGLT